MSSCPDDARRRKFNASAMLCAESRLPSGCVPFGRQYGFTRRDWVKGRTASDQVAGFLVGCNRHALAYELRAGSVIFRGHLDDHRDFAAFDLPRGWSIDFAGGPEVPLVREPSFARPRTHEQVILLTPAGNPIDPSYRPFSPQIGDAIVAVFAALRPPVTSDLAGAIGQREGV